MGVTMGDSKWRAVPHHLCHVAGTFYDSPHEEALCVTLDGSGECSSSLVCVAKARWRGRQRGAGRVVGGRIDAA